MPTRIYVTNHLSIPSRTTSVNAMGRIFTRVTISTFLTQLTVPGREQIVAQCQHRPKEIAIVQSTQSWCLPKLHQGLAKALAC